MVGPNVGLTSTIINKDVHESSTWFWSLGSDQCWLLCRGIPKHPDSSSKAAVFSDHHSDFDWKTAVLRAGLGFSRHVKPGGSLRSLCHLPGWHSQRGAGQGATVRALLPQVIWLV